MRTTQSTLLFEVDDAATLARALSRLEIDVPARHLGGRKELEERWSCTHLLATLPVDDWAFPLRLQQQDRPDFLLADARGEIGIECVDAVPQNSAHAAVLRGRGHGPKAHFIERASPFDPVKKVAEIIAEIEEDRFTPGFEGNASEADWVVAIAYFIDKKVQAVTKPDFRRYERNWLLIYDDWPAPSLDKREAGMTLLAHDSLVAGLACFDRIFVLDCATLWEFGAQGMTLSALRGPSSR
jgi:hypothetical protein